jgi:alanyl-tRNA synthetase
MNFSHKNILCFILINIANFAFGQLFINEGTSLANHYFTHSIDTTFIQGDSIFVKVSEFDRNVLALREDQVFLYGSGYYS